MRFGALSDNKCLTLDLSSWPIASRKVAVNAGCFFRVVIQIKLDFDS